MALLWLQKLKLLLPLSILAGRLLACRVAKTGKQLVNLVPHLGYFSGLDFGGNGAKYQIHIVELIHNFVVVISAQVRPRAIAEMI